MNFVYDLIIIGAGPAGSSAAVNAKDRVNRILIIEKSLVGGKIVDKKVVENYLGFRKISGSKFSNLVTRQLLDCEQITLKRDNVTSIAKKDQLFEVTTLSDSFFGISVIIATGSRERTLEIPGQAKIMTSYGVPKLLNLFKNKKVAVIGGGYVACQTAVSVSKNAKRVYLINANDELNCDSKTQELINKEQVIEVISNSSAAKLAGDGNDDHLLINSDSTIERKIAIDNLVVCIGWMPNSELIADFCKLDQSGYVEVDRYCSTSVSGLFAVGDTLKKRAWNIANAISDGALAAQSAINYLSRLK